MRGVLAVEDWAEIRRLFRAEGLAARAIARRLGVSRGAVARALASAEPPRYSRALRGSAVDAFEPVPGSHFYFTHILIIFKVSIPIINLNNLINW